MWIFSIIPQHLPRILKKEPSRKGIHGGINDSFRYKTQKPILNALPKMAFLRTGRKFFYFPKRELTKKSQNLIPN